MTSSETSGRYREIHAHMARGDRESALAVLAELQRQNPADATAHFLSGRIALEVGKLADAKASFARAAELDPSVADHHAFLGFCQVSLDDPSGAMRSAETALGLGPGDRTLDLIATIQSRLGQHEAAAASLARAVAEGSLVPAIHFNLGIQLKYIGDFTAARRAIERAIEIDPEHIKARAALSALRAASTSDNQISELEALLARTGDPARRLFLAHALAGEFEALGEYGRAFHLLDSAKTAVRARLGPAHNGDEQLFDAIHSAFGRPVAAKGYPNAQPIFVVGMPRSGTTVVERMLSLHPDVRSVGETMHMSAVLREAAGHPLASDGMSYRSAHLLEARDVGTLAAQTDFSSVGRAFMDRVQASDPRRPVDKFPLNSLLAGFILTALPNARVICVVRGAMDTIVGNYRQLLDVESPIYRYTLSIESCARYYVRFRRLADLWSSLFPNRFRAIGYESLVADPDLIGREMFEFCGLSWHSGFARIEANQGPVTTASAVQVREPLNARRIGSWRSFEPFVGEALSILAEARVQP